MKYECIQCNFVTPDKNKYEKHLISKKHLNNYNGFKKDNDNNYICNFCNKSFSYRQNINRHITSQHKNEDLQNNKVENSEKNDTLINKLIQKIDEKDKLIEEKNSKLEKQNLELFNMIKELSLQKSNNIHIENNNSNNKTLNYQNITNYLNDKCADALNVEDFIPMIEVTLNDLLKITNNNMKRKDAVKMILEDNLNKLDFDKQPFKCSDIKRKKIYAKTGGEWINDVDFHQTKKVFRNINFKASMKSEEPETKEILEQTDMCSYELRKPLSYGCSDNEIEKHIESEKRILSEVTYYKNEE